MTTNDRPWLREPDEEIRIVPYDPSWPLRFQQQREALRGAAAEWIVDDEIHHIGSTAVPGLEAKPTVDIMVGVISLEASRPMIERLTGRGWQYAPYRTEVMDWFCRPSFSHREHHLHAIPVKSPIFRERLAFRDALRADAELRGRYVGLKRDLARRFPNDREAYTDGKSSFVVATLIDLGVRPSVASQAGGSREAL